MIGLDVTHKALFTRAHADRLRGTGRPGRVVAELSDFFQRVPRQRYGFDGSPIHDAMAVAHVDRPDARGTVHCNVEIETASQFCDGRTVVDRWHATSGTRNAHVGVDVDADAVPRAARSSGSRRCRDRLRRDRAARRLDLAPGAARRDGGARPPLRRGGARHRDRRHAAQRPRRGALRGRHRRPRRGVGVRPRARAGAPRGRPADPRSLVRRQRRVAGGDAARLGNGGAAHAHAREARRRRRAGARPAARGAPPARRGDRRAAGPPSRSSRRADHGHAHDADGPYGFDPAAAVYDAKLLEILGSGRLDFRPLAEHVEAAKADSLWQLLVLQGALGEAARSTCSPTRRRRTTGWPSRRYPPREGATRADASHGARRRSGRGGSLPRGLINAIPSSGGSASSRSVPSSAASATPAGTAAGWATRSSTASSRSSAAPRGCCRSLLVALGSLMVAAQRARRRASVPRRARRPRLRAR